MSQESIGAAGVARWIANTKNDAQNVNEQKKIGKQS